MRRRTLLAGAAAALVTVGGGAAAPRTLEQAARSADAEEASYAKLLAEVHDDYINGRVVQHEGWILSQHEVAMATANQHGQKIRTFN
ncbi:MAG TPA: hypothetical protein VL418_04340 [Devosiaceae bacterium]|nr:hypothetical protein [Devosiaceae bacterium]